LINYRNCDIEEMNISRKIYFLRKIASIPRSPTIEFVLIREMSMENLRQLNHVRKIRTTKASTFLIRSQRPKA